jgi:hypothetical protein
MVPERLYRQSVIVRSKTTPAFRLAPTEGAGSVGVLGIEIQERHRNLVFLILLGQSRHDVCLAHASFAHRQNHTLPWRSLSRLYRAPLT